MLEKASLFVTENWAVLLALGGFVGTNLVGMVVYLVQRQFDFRFRVREERLKRLRAQKNDFYDQILNLMQVNEHMFETFGPASFREISEGKRSALADEWEAVRSSVILPNNLTIQHLLQTKAHLLNDNDAIQNYQPLLAHIAAYPLFLNKPTERYSKKMRFPETITRHIITQRDLIIRELSRYGAS